MNDRRHIRTAPTLVLAAVLSIWVLGWAPAAAGATGGVSGTVTNGTTGKPAAGVAVTLALFDQSQQLTSVTSKTDDQGRYSFPPPPAQAQGYQVTAVFKGVPYQAQMAPLTAGQPATQDLTVWDTTTDPAKVTVTDWIVWVDRENGGAAIQHDVRWRNTGDAAYIGKQTTADGTPITTTLPLEPGATNAQFLGVYLTTPGRAEGNTYVNPQPIAPGTSSATMRYSVPELGSLTLPITLPTQSLQLYAPTDMEITASGLTPAGSFTDPQTNATYQRWTASDLAVGDSISVEVTGVAVSSSKTRLLAVAGGLALLALVALVTGLLLRRRSRGPGKARGATRTRASKQPSRRETASKNGHRTRSPERVAQASATASDDDISDLDVEEEFDLLIDEIAALDLAHEKGVLDDRRYEALRAAAKERLRRLREARTTGGRVHR